MARARLRMPLRHRAAAGEQHHRVVRVGRFRQRSDVVKEEPCAAVGREEAAVFEEAPLAQWAAGGCLVRGPGPLDAAFVDDHRVVADARDVARLPRGQALENPEDGLGMGPLAEQPAAAPAVGDAAEDLEIRERLPRRLGHLLHDADAPLGVDERAVLFAGRGCGQHEVGELRGLRCRVHVLHDEEVELCEYAGQRVAVDPGMGGVGRDHPETLDLSRVDRLEDPDRTRDCSPSGSASRRCRGSPRPCACAPR